MKGIVTVSQQDLDKKPGLMQSLASHSEKVIKAEGKIMFYSKDGTLMTIICGLLDNEVVYKLTFEKSSVAKR
jgi:hypothetical protein